MTAQRDAWTGATYGKALKKSSGQYGTDRDVSPWIMHDYQCINDIYGVTEPFRCSAISKSGNPPASGDHTMQAGQVLDRLLRKNCPDMHKLRRTAQLELAEVLGGDVLHELAGLLMERRALMAGSRAGRYPT
jgi:hypothetical protein